MNEMNNVLYDFLVESSLITRSEFMTLEEEVKKETVKELVTGILDNIKDKIPDNDTTLIDKSRGNIKNFINLPEIQNSVTRLSNLVLSTDEYFPGLSIYVNTIIEAIKNLNKYVNEFKNAYREKKTVLMLQYQSVILSLITSISYLISVAVDCKDPNNIRLKQNFTIEDIAPLKSLTDFNKAVTDGRFQTYLKDTDTLREFYTEYSVEEYKIIYEAPDIIGLIKTGLENFSRNTTGNGKVMQILYKVAGVVMLILSLRQVFYTINNNKYKISEYLGNIKSFLNLGNLNQSTILKFNAFNNRSPYDLETATKETENEIAIENKDFLMKAKTAIPTSFGYTPETIPERNVATDNDLFAGLNF